MRMVTIGLLTAAILLPTVAWAQEQPNGRGLEARATEGVGEGPATETRAEAAPTDWIDREKLRTAYFYARPPADEKVQQLVDVGMNAMILKAAPEKALPYLREAKKHDAMHTFLALNFSVNAEEEGLRQAVLKDGRVERYACPLEVRFWQDYLLEGMLERARLANDPQLQVDGLWIDFELYATRTGQRYYTNACYCDYCMSEFAAEAGVEVPELALDERHPWLAEYGHAEEYKKFLQGRVEDYAIDVREQVHAVNADLLLGFYPTPHNWSLVGVARAFSTERLPIILWATDTYGGGGPNRVPDDWRRHYEDLGINARYCAGMLLRRYSAKNLAAYIYHTSAECDGYWLFTTYTLWNPVEKHKGDYYLAAGTPEQYWQAIERGNDELDRLAEAPDYQTDLEIGIEPIVYHPLAKPELRRRIEALDLPAVTRERIEYPTVWLRGPNLLLVAGEAGRQVTIEVEFAQIGPGTDQVKWQASDADGVKVTGDSAEPGGDALVRFTPEHDGLHYVLISAGTSRYALTSADTPTALYAGAGLHVMADADRLYFAVPEGTDEFTVLGEGSSARERVKVKVYAPTGELAGTAESGPDEPHDAPVTIEPGEHAGETWWVEIAKPDQEILEDNFLTLEAPLPPAVSLSEEHVFGVR